jgi:hypothetical protein
MSESAVNVVGRVIRADDADYEAARRVWNWAIDRRPELIVRCTETRDAVKTLEYARLQ